MQMLLHMTMQINIKDALYRQLFNPVRWVETVQTMIADGAESFIELGPGKVLTGLCKRIDRKCTKLLCS